MECKVNDNAQQCTCPAEGCERRGICCDCLRNHLSKKSLPMCMKQLDWIQTTG